MPPAQKVVRPCDPGCPRIRYSLCACRIARKDLLARARFFRTRGAVKKSCRRPPITAQEGVVLQNILRNRPPPPAPLKVASLHFV